MEQEGVMVERMAEYVGFKDPIGEGLYNMGLTEERIVRCRDCERWSDEPPNYREEPQWCGRFSCHAEPDGFCKWGKPRSER
jgi:hypothetical protein